jgi:hypothetical protein
MKLLLTIALSLFSFNAAAAYKCVVNGKTIYSSSMCAEDAQQFSIDKDSDWTMKLKVRTAPKEDARLNAIGAPRQPSESEAKPPSQPPVANRQKAGKSPENAEFNCDGRDRCSQMTSCQEATFFLENCPNQQTDGDSNGIPCERQWCGNNSGSDTDSDNAGRRRRGR